MDIKKIIIWISRYPIIMAKSNESRNQYFNGIRKTKPIHDEIQRRFKEYVSNYKIQGETELIYTIIEDFLNRQGLPIDESKIDQFWEKHRLLFNMEEKGKPSIPTLLSEYIEQSIFDIDKKRECYLDLFDAWFKFQKDILNTFFILDSFPSYIEFLLDSGRLIKDSQFQALNALFLNNPENRPKIAYEFFRKRFASEIFYFLKAGDLLSNIEQIPFEKFVNFLPAMAELREGSNKEWFGEMAMPQDELLEDSLSNWGFFLSHLRGKEEGRSAPFSIESIEEVIKEEGEAKIKEEVKNIYYSLVTHQEITIKNLEEILWVDRKGDKSIEIHRWRVFLKVIPGIQTFIDFAAFFEYLWNTKKITHFLEKICIYRTYEYFIRYTKNLRDLIHNGSELFRKYSSKLGSLNQFITKLDALPRSQALQAQIIKMDLIKKILQLTIEDEKRSESIFRESYRFQNYNLACLQKQNPFISTWDEFTQNENINRFLSRKLPKHLEKAYQEDLVEAQLEDLEERFRQNPDLQKQMTEFIEKMESLKKGSKEEKP